MSSNICATASNPYNIITSCENGPQTEFAADVWYSFVATGTILQVQVNSEGDLLQTPNISLYEYDGNCSSLIARNCVVGANGVATLLENVITIGQTYYLQISGNDTNDQCNFTLNIKNNYNCGACLLESSIDFPYEAPINNTFGCGETISICYTVEKYNQTAANWFHGIVPVFGEGWDFPNSFVSINVPNSCSGDGEWGLYESVISSNTGNTYGPGWFYDSNNGGLLDGNPGNNFGDSNLNGYCTWEFCFQISTLPCDVATEGMNLSIEFENYGDSESGSWSSEACADDPNFTFQATLGGCIAPSIAVNAPIVCENIDTVTTLSATLLSGNSNISWQWYNGSLPIAGQTSNMAMVPITSTPTTYSVIGINDCGTDTASVTISRFPSIELNPVFTPSYCEDNNGSIDLGLTGNYTFEWTGNTSIGDTGVANNLANGIYYVTVTSADGCEISTSFDLSYSNLQISGSIDDPNCNANNVTIETIVTGGEPPYSYIWNTEPVQTTASATNLTTGTYSVTVTDAQNCQLIKTVQVTDKAAPNIIAIEQLYNNSNNIGLYPIIDSDVTYYEWFFQADTDATAQVISSTENTVATQNGIYTLIVANQDACFAFEEVIINNIDSSCPYPTNRTETFDINGPNTLRLSWNGNNEATSYEIAGRKVGGNGSWLFWTTTNTYRDFSGITSGTYEWSVRAFCDSETSDWVLPAQQFTYNSAEKTNFPNPFDSDNVAALSNLNIYPNPANSQVTLEYQQNIGYEKVVIAIFDMLGKKVFEQKQNTNLGTNIILIDISSMKKACYFVRIDNGKEQITEKLMIF